MPNYASLITSPAAKPVANAHQTQMARPDQKQNNAGGFVFKLDPWKQLERFLILGSDSNTYYSTARALTKENAGVIEACYALDFQKTIDTIVNVSVEGRAPKNDPAIFALALGTTNVDVKVRQAVYATMFKVCRTSTHIFQFIDVSRTLGKGWGRGLKNAISRFYSETPVDQLAYQIVKYRNRNNYSHTRLLQTSHPKFDFKKEVERSEMFKFVVGKAYDRDLLPRGVRHFVDLQAKDAPVINLLREQPNTPWEAIPTESLNNPEVWTTLLPGMGLTALMRNLGKMSALGILKPLSKEEALVVARFNDAEDIKKSRLHPMNILFAMKTYASGRGFRGTNIWPVNREVVSALEKAFYHAFGTLSPGKKRTFIALDVSASMASPIMNTNLMCSEASAAMALVTIRQEPQVMVRGFTAAGQGNRMGGGNSALTDLGIGRNDDLQAIMAKTRGKTFGGTDCSAPMRYALDNKLDVDQFVVYTDNETYAGKEHPYKVLQEYRERSGIDAKMVVVGMTSTGFSIADPNDPLSLDVVGFDTSAPALIANH